MEFDRNLNSKNI